MFDLKLLLLAFPIRLNAYVDFFDVVTISSNVNREMLFSMQVFSFPSSLLNFSSSLTIEMIKLSSTDIWWTKSVFLYTTNSVMLRFC